MQICQPQLPFAILLWVVCSWLDGFPTDARFLGCVCYALHQLKIILANCDYFISIFYLLVRIGPIPWQILFNWISFQIYGHWPKSLLFSCWLQWYTWLELENDMSQYSGKLWQKALTEETFCIFLNSGVLGNVDAFHILGTKEGASMVISFVEPFTFNQLKACKTVFLFIKEIKSK